MNVLSLNGGSSSLKFAAYSAQALEPVLLVTGMAPAGGNAGAALDRVLAEIVAQGPPAAVGHRIVFGGRHYTEPTLADPGVLSELEKLGAIEPLHLRAELDLVHAVERRFPGMPQVLCFDTAFHRQAPLISRRLPLPDELDPLLERYGFHGLSYEYVSSQLGADSGRTIIAHLGSGASLCALEGQKPLDTTMGFSVLGGLMMATRPGDLDPGIVLQLLQADGYNADKLAELFYRRSGLRGVSGWTGGIRELLAAAEEDERARNAVELFIYQLVKHLGSMAATLRGLDTLVFTGGIGEHAPSVRAAVCESLRFLGVRLDPHANASNARTISSSESRVAVMVIPTDENIMIARHTLAVLSRSNQ